MNNNKTITQMYSGFIGIVVSLKRHAKVIGKAQLNKKLLSSLPTEWRRKVTAIEDGKNCKEITIEELLGSLITHDHTLQREEGEFKKEKETFGSKTSNW